MICPNCGEDNPERFAFCGVCGTRLAERTAPPQEARKTVTVVFCDLVGSTALGERLDSESLREVMDRYFTEMRTVLERHGGIVEKYIGDAIMAIFGLPRAHEDDALRAIRAASEMGVALERLNAELERGWGVTLVNRTGVNTGEVVVGDPSSGQRLATGDAVNVAARLEQAAPTNCVLVGEPTYRLVRDAVSVEAVEPLALKGKSDRLPAFRLVEVRPEAEGIARRLDAPLVGRSEELAALLEAFDAVAQENRCHLVTVFGEAGVGKSRVLAELAEHLRPRAAVLKGRCLSYGEGITFWPLAEMVRQAAGIDDEDSADEARRKIADLMVGTEGGIADRVASVIGLSSASFPIEESFWAARRLLEQLARDKPLVVIFEDIHWAEPTFLDWVSHVVDLAQGPILVVCAARPELRDQHPSWGQDIPRASLLDLQPLTASDSEVLIDNLLGASGASPEITSRITAAAQGNPLFVEQIISMWIDDETLNRDDGSWGLRTEASTSIPPTISALLAARLDRLDQEERTVVAGASVVGQVFYQGAVEELCPPVVRPKVPTSLSVLEAKQFVRPDSSTLADEQAFAFRHVLIRDAAYEAILKRTRAELHERFASWLERMTGERITEYEEIVGYHLEQAYKYRSTLGVLNAEARALGVRAAHVLASAGTRAMARSDVASAVSLLERAVALIPEEDDSRLQVMLRFGIALARIGNTTRAEKILLTVADCSGDAGTRLHANIERAFLAIARATPQGVAEAQHLAEESIPVFEQLGDGPGIAKAWRLLATVSWTRAQFHTGIAALRQALTASKGHDKFQEMQITSDLVMAMAFGPTPVPEVIREGEEMLERVQDRLVVATLLSTLRLMYAYVGQFDHARDLGKRATAICRDLGQSVLLGWWSEEAALVEIAAGNLSSAEHELRRGCDSLSKMGEQAALSTKAAILADVILAQGRYEEADQYVSLSKKSASPDDIASQARWRAVRSKIMAADGRDDQAFRLGREAAALADTSDDLDLRGDIWLCRAHALRQIGRSNEAVDSAKNALALYELKGNIVSAAKASNLLRKLLGASATC